MAPGTSRQGPAAAPAAAAAAPVAPQPATKAPKIVEWRKSEAKIQLRHDIIRGVVDENMAAEDVYLMRPQYVDYNLYILKITSKTLLKQ